MADIDRIEDAAYRRYQMDAVFHTRVDLIERLLGFPRRMFHSMIAVTMLISDEITQAVEAERKGLDYAPPSWWPRSPYDARALQEMIGISLVKEMSPEAFGKFFNPEAFHG